MQVILPICPVSFVVPLKSATEPRRMEIAS